MTHQRHRCARSDPAVPASIGQADLASLRSPVSLSRNRHGGIETLRAEIRQFRLISSRHQYGTGFQYTQKIDRLDMYRMAQSLEGGLQKTFALRRMGMDRCGDVFEPRAHLERQAETSRQFRNPSAHSLNAE